MKYNMKKGAVSFLLAAAMLMVGMACSSTTVKAAGNTVDEATPIVTGTAYSGVNSLTNPVDFYKFTISRSGKLTLDAKKYTDKKNCEWELFDAGGKSLRYNKPGYDSNRGYSYCTDEYYALAGTYYVKVYGNWGDYQFSVNYEDSNETYTETQTLRNDTIGQAKPAELKKVYRGQVSKAQDEADFYKFTVPYRTEVFLDYNLYSTDSYYFDRPYYKVFDANGKEEGAWSMSYDANRLAYHNVNSFTLDKGTHYLKIGAAGGSRFGFYDFKLYVHEHKFRTKITKAAPGVNGTITEICDCGEVKSTKTIYAPKTMTLSKIEYVYNGKAQKPTVKVKDAKGKVMPTSAYTVKWPSGRAKVGTYKVTVKFKGNYKGSLSQTFTIQPKGTKIASLKAKSKGFQIKLKKQAKETTGYQVQYATVKSFKSGAKIKTITKNSKVTETYTKLKPRKKYYVRVRTYKQVGGKKYYSEWSPAKVVTTKK